MQTSIKELFLAKDKEIKILFISLQGIGDLLFILPAVRLLKEKLPRSKIYALTFKKNSEILLDEPALERIFICNNPGELNILNIFNILAILRKERFDLAICAYPGGLRSAVIAFLSGVKFRLGHEYTYLRKFPFLFNLKIKVPQVKHIIELNLDILSCFGEDLNKTKINLSLAISDKDKELIEGLFTQQGILASDFVIGLHPATSISRLGKCWPMENFAKLAKSLIEKFKARILIFGAKEESNLVLPLSDISPFVIDFTGKLTIKQTYAAIKRCNLFISNDSALAHLAAAANVPTVAIFGPTDPRLYSPYGQGHLVIRKGLNCSPCAYGVCGYIDCIQDKGGFKKDSFICQKNNFECMKDISVDEVINKVSDFIQSLKKVT